MKRSLIPKTILPTLCVGISLAAIQIAQADTWTGGTGKFEDPTKWGYGLVPSSVGNTDPETPGLRTPITIDGDGDHCLADADTWQYLLSNGLLNGTSTTVYRGATRAFFGSTDGVKTISFTLDIGNGNMFQMVTNANSYVAEKAGNDVTLNIASGTLQTGKRLILAEADTSSATVNITGGRLEVGRDQLIIGNDSATPSTPLLSITDGSLTVRNALELRSGTFEIQGSTATEIRMGTGNVDGAAQIDGTIKVAIGPNGITPIQVNDADGNAADGVAGDVTFEAGSLLDVSFLSAPVGGTFTILERQGGAITDNGLAFAPGVDTNVWSFNTSFDGTTGKLTVTSSVPDLYWDGGESADWESATGTSNWVLFSGAAADYVEPSSVTFDDLLDQTALNTTVNLTSTFNDVSVTAGNSTNDYIFNGNGGFSSNVTLTKTGTGSLTISNVADNTFSGGITISNGSLVLNGGDGGNSTTTTGLTVEADALLEISSGSDLTIDSTPGNAFAGRLMGDGSLTIDGAGQTHVFSNVLSEYTGSIVIAAGTLQSNGSGGSNALGGNTRGVDSNGLPNGPGYGGPIQIGDDSNQDATLFINGYSSLKSDQDITVVGSGAHLLRASNNNTTQVTFAQDITLTNADLTVEHTGRSGYRMVGPMTGTGNLEFLGNTADTRVSNTIDVRAQINNIGTITNNGTGNNSLNINGGQNGSIGANVTGIVQNNVSADPGVLISDFIINSDNSSFVGTADVLAGTMRLSNAGALNSANTVSVETGAILDVQNDVTIAGLNDVTGGGSVTNEGDTDRTLTIGGNGSYSFSGVIADGTTNILTVVVSGSGTQTLTGTNTYSGSTTLLGGTLAVDGDAISDSGSLILDGGSIAVTGAETVDTLFVGAVQQDAGTYTNAEIPAITSGSIIVVTSPPVVTDPFDVWAVSKGLTPGVNDGPTDDPDSDGDNLYEYFFWDSDPLVADVFGSELRQVVGATFAFAHDRPKDISDVTVTYQWTTDLSAAWTDDGQSDGTNTVVFATGTIGAPANGNSDDYESVEVTPSVSVGDIPSQIFVRVSVSPAAE